MAVHQRPTEEELKAQEEEAIKLAEELEKNPPAEEDEEEAPEEKKSESEDEDASPEEDEDNKGDDAEVEQEAEKEGEEAEPSKELYKKKFSASSRENQKINAKNRVINQALIEADGIPEPTEEELAQTYSDWDIMTDTEKHLAKETLISKQWRASISKAKEQATKIDKWNDSVETFVDDPKTLIDNPELEGKTEEFKSFAIEEENNSVPFKILISAFLHEQSTKKVSHKGRMFERGKGGSNDKPQPRSDKISLEDARKLRETDYPKWKEKLAEGKIDFSL